MAGSDNRLGSVTPGLWVALVWGWLAPTTDWLPAGVSDSGVMGCCSVGWLAQTTDWLGSVTPGLWVAVVWGWLAQTTRGSATGGTGGRVPPFLRVRGDNPPIFRKIVGQIR